MKFLWTDRRLFIAFTGMLCLLCLGYFKNQDVSMFIATIVASVAAANATENIKTAKKNPGNSNDK